MLVGVGEEETEIYHLVDGAGTIDSDRYDRVYLIVLNMDRAETEDDCAFAPYSVEVRAGESAGAPDQIEPTGNYLPPFVEDLDPP
jgi:hypothetical protein